MPKELRPRENRLAAIRAAKACLEADARDRDDAPGRKPEWDRNPKGGRPSKLKYGETPGEVLADSGYSNEEDLAALEARGIDGYVALGREGRAAGEPDPEKLPATARMAKRLATPEGRAVYAKRKWIAEAPIGWITEAVGFRRFSLRGLENVRGEWDLVCLPLNVRRLHVLRSA